MGNVLDHEAGDSDPLDVQVCENLLFLTHLGQSWASETDRRNAVAVEFRKLKIAAKCHRTGVGFYALRHMTETVGGELANQVAVDHLMGHVDGSMAGTYREGVSDARIKKVCQHVRKWWKGGAK